MLYWCGYVTCLTRSCISSWATERAIGIDESCPHKCRLEVQENAVIEASDIEAELAAITAEPVADASGGGADETEALINAAENEDQLV